MEKLGGAGLQECHRRLPPPPFIVQNECSLMKDHFMETAKIVGNACNNVIMDNNNGRL